MQSYCQFALNEMSFFLVRLLQSFDDITLAPDAQPPWSHPPAHWKQGSGRMPIEKILPQTHLTSYIYVRFDIPLLILKQD